MFHVCASSVANSVQYKEYVHNNASLRGTGHRRLSTMNINQCESDTANDGARGVTNASWPLIGAEPIGGKAVHGDHASMVPRTGASNTWPVYTTDGSALLGILTVHARSEQNPASPGTPYAAWFMGCLRGDMDDSNVRVAVALPATVHTAYISFGFTYARPDAAMVDIAYNIASVTRVGRNVMSACPHTPCAVEVALTNSLTMAAGASYPTVALPMVCRMAGKYGALSTAGTRVLADARSDNVQVPVEGGQFTLVISCSGPGATASVEGASEAWLQKVDQLNAEQQCMVRDIDELPAAHAAARAQYHVTIMDEARAAIRAATHARLVSVRNQAVLDVQRAARQAAEEAVQRERSAAHAAAQAADSAAGRASQGTRVADSSAIRGHMSRHAARPTFSRVHKLCKEKKRQASPRSRSSTQPRSVDTPIPCAGGTSASACDISANRYPSSDEESVGGAGGALFGADDDDDDDWSNVRLGDRAPVMDGRLLCAPESSSSYGSYTDGVLPRRNNTDARSIRYEEHCMSSARGRPTPAVQCCTLPHPAAVSSNSGALSLSQPPQVNSTGASSAATQYERASVITASDTITRSMRQVQCELNSRASLEVVVDICDNELDRVETEDPVAAATQTIKTAMETVRTLTKTLLDQRNWLAHANRTFQEALQRERGVVASAAESVVSDISRGRTPQQSASASTRNTLIAFYHSILSSVTDEVTRAPVTLQDAEGAYTILDEVEV